MPGRERRRLVEEEQLGELAWLQERRAVPVLVDEAARDPALDLVAAADPPLRIVEAAAVSVDEPACLRRDEVAQRRDTVLEGHAPRFYRYAPEAGGTAPASASAAIRSRCGRRASGPSDSAA